ncbi:MAG: hypothetical protein HC769_02115 [Cyanobacteria bacterium CRU_2_1]|nr:hypothetical protein [Cyanobacteria bacterium CRU_2_1]
MITTYINPQIMQLALKDMAVKLQAHFLHEEGEGYRVEDLQQALTRWLEASIDSLVEDALFHTVEGDRSCAFNRRVFEQQMKRIQSIDARTLPQDRLLQTLSKETLKPLSKDAKGTSSDRAKIEDVAA